MYPSVVGVSALHITVPKMKKENTNIPINVSQNNGTVLTLKGGFKAL